MTDGQVSVQVREVCEHRSHLRWSSGETCTGGLLAVLWLLLLRYRVQLRWAQRVSGVD